MSCDLSLLFRSNLRAGALLDDVCIGAVLQNPLQLPMRYGSGHEEKWETSWVVGGSIRLVQQIVLAADLAPTRRSVCLGVEWKPLAVLAVRGGLRYEGVFMFSFGMGLWFAGFTVDYACVVHPHLTSQHRVTFGASWNTALPQR